MTGIWIIKHLGKSLEISLKNDSNESKENWVNLNKRYLMRDINIHVDYVKEKLYVNMVNKIITVKFVWVVLYVNRKDGDTFAKNAMEKGICEHGKQRAVFVILAEAVMICKHVRREKIFVKECWKLQLDSVNN